MMKDIYGNVKLQAETDETLDIKVGLLEHWVKSYQPNHNYLFGRKRAEVQAGDGSEELTPLVGK